MRREGFTPVIAEDGPSAVCAVSSEHPDVLLVDYRMPGMNGMEVLRRVRQLDENLPVVLITAYAEVTGAVEAIRAGAYDYLSKPFNHHDVIRIVWRALRDRESKLGQRRCLGKPGGLRSCSAPAPLPRN